MTSEDYRYRKLKGNALTLISRVMLIARFGTCINITFVGVPYTLLQYCFASTNADNSRVCMIPA